MNFFTMNILEYLTKLRMSFLEGECQPSLKRQVQQSIPIAAALSAALDTAVSSNKKLH